MPISDRFHIAEIDYGIFTVMLCLSAAISIYFGYFRNRSKRTDSADEYMFGGRQMPVVPICLSVIASTLSSIALIAIPRETYYYGTVMLYLVIGETTAAVLLYFFYIPVFYEQKFSSIFEYVERRFSKPVRCFGSVLYAITQLFYSLITIYASCSAISQVTPLSFYIFAPVTSIICTIYSVIGGLRGVVWADVLQAIFMFFSMITFIIIGFYNIDDEKNIVDILKDGGRWNHFEFDPSLYTRITVMGNYLSAIGLGLFNTCTNQGTMQRYLSLSSFKQVKLVIIIGAFFTSFFLLLSVILGIAIYGNYHDCDPVLTGNLKDSNHFTIYYAMETGMKLPGFAGLILAGSLSASLSSMSTMITSISANIFEDVLKPALPWKLNSRQTNYFNKGISFFCGLIITCGIFVIDPAGGIYQVFRTLTSMTGSLIVFIFGFGLFFRKANTKGVTAGCIAGLIVALWLGIGGQMAISQGTIEYGTKIVTTKGCHLDNSTAGIVNITESGHVDRVPVKFDENLLFPYRISYNYLLIISVLVCTIVGVTVSLLTSDTSEVDEELLIPQLRRKDNITINKDYKKYEAENNNNKQTELKILNVDN